MSDRVTDRGSGEARGRVLLRIRLAVTCDTVAKASSKHIHVCLYVCQRRLAPSISSGKSLW
jgi:hypothetical protein